MATTAVRREAVGLRSNRGRLLASLMLSTGLIALDTTIINTAILTISDRLGGFALFPWVFSIYLLVQAVTVPIYGKLADTFGRKPVMLFGVAVFALGSLLCGLASNMVALIVFRAIQGIGAGAVLPMTVTITGDVYSLEERARVQGYMAGVWAGAAVLGPLVGGILVEFVGWRSIFLINVPLCAVAAVMIARNLTETTPTRRTGPIDFLGAGLLTVGAGALLLALLEGGHAWAWTSATSVWLFVLSFAMICAFLLTELRAVNPLLPLHLLSRTVVATGCAVSMMVGALITGITAYVPTFTQGVLGASAMVAGLTIGAVSIGWPLTSSQSGKIYLRIGFRACTLIGGVVNVAGCVLLWAMSDSVGAPWRIALACLIIGLGLGLVSTPSLIAAQTSCEWDERGVVTSSNMFARSVGSAIGAAVFGAMVNAHLTDPDHPQPAELSSGITTVFLAMTGAAVLTMLATVTLPGRAGMKAQLARS
ncbi:MFS transporter [Nocardia camponoti]|uniref:MFS transporter n=1 Tax=Nocardia camponoti TaxID=1616106 RepID=A0A917V362_9NOCA|nr:MFS transporter [Nocardia camponoti]GGK33285.1 MFS transporter [Nocardia camponoti]